MTTPQPQTDEIPRLAREHISGFVETESSPTGKLFLEELAVVARKIRESEREACIADIWTLDSAESAEAAIRSRTLP